MGTSDFQRDADFVFRLVQSGVSLAEGFPRLIEFCQTHYPKRDWGKIAAVDVAADIETMVNWLTHVFTTEPPPPNIVAYYFGLYNPSDGETVTCGFYVCGSTQFSVEDPAWAVWRKDSYIPEGRDAPLNNLNHIYTSWNDIEYDNDSADPSQWSDDSEYVLFLGYAGLMVGELGRRVPPSVWLGSASKRVLAVGWDEGDILEVGKIRPTGFEK